MFVDLVYFWRKPSLIFLKNLVFRERELDIEIREQVAIVDPVMVRCELFSTLLKEKGFQEVYQLEGGVLKYGAQAQALR